MTAFVADQDFTLYVGDVSDVLATLPDGSVDCVVTSPPYWGLRDYGTGQWEGGNPDCDHIARKATPQSGLPNAGANSPEAMQATIERLAEQEAIRFRDVCGKCGARRVDQQLGLEPTLDQYVQNMVGVFREVRRVLADHGTCWVNLGDSYASGTANGGQSDFSSSGLKRDGRPEASRVRTLTQNAKELGRPQPAQRLDTGLKPKDLVGIPWRVAFALQADGWYLRADVIWAKPNPMPESVTDRPTKAHEYVFLLSKRPRYWFDQEAVREELKPESVERYAQGYNASWKRAQVASITDERENGFHGTPDMLGNGRNVRSVWEIATQPYPEAHFATYPEELVRRCLLAGCPVRVCRVCGLPSERIVDVDYEDAGRNNNSLKTKGGGDAEAAMSARPYETRKLKHVTTTGWSDCGHNNWRPGIVLDPFLGSGTTAQVARQHGRHCVGIELNPAYAQLAAKRLQQLSLLAEAHA